MEDNEVVGLLRELEGLAQGVGLDGLVEQERATARAGQIKEFGQTGRTPASAGPIYAPRKGEFRIEPVSPRQRLAVLLDLLEAAVVGADLTEEAVLASAKTLVEHGSIAQVEVTFDVPSESADLVTAIDDSGATDIRDGRRVLSSLRSDEREESIVAVARAINGLRREAGVARGEWLREVEASEQSGKSWPA